MEFRQKWSYEAKCENHVFWMVKSNKRNELKTYKNAHSLNGEIFLFPIQ